MDYYRQRIAAAKMTDHALAGEHRFRWQTDFDYSWMGGWMLNQDKPFERNIVAVIPGRDRSRAVIMADHYDTAYMEDKYVKESGGKGARLAACGADDNHSATAALMLAAPIFLELSKQGELGCDVWLIHLTGEEFPADCLGARHLSQALVEGTLTLHTPDGQAHDLSNTQVAGVYVSDMIAHNNDRERDIFQITPGTSRASIGLAEQAHLANAVWNASVPVWNQRTRTATLFRKRRRTWRRSARFAPSPIRAARCSTPTARFFPMPACRWCCSWRTTTSIASAITIRKTTCPTSIWITVRPWRRSRSNRWRGWRRHDDVSGRRAR